MSYFDENRVCDAAHYLTDMRVVVKDANGDETLCESVIAAHNKEYHTIEVRAADHIKRALPTKVLLIILLKDSILHFHGTVRPSYLMGRVEIALYKGTEKEDRVHQRYTLDVKGTVSGIGFENQMIPLQKHISVMVGNISRNGVMIRAENSSFTLDSYISLTIGGQDNQTLLNCKVVRVRELSIMEAEYGCKLENMDG